MKYIQLQSDIIIKDPITGVPIQGQAPISHVEVVVRTLLTDKTWHTSRATMNMANKIEALFIGSKNGVVALEDTDFAELKKVAEAPSGGFVGTYAKQIAPFLNAICDASDKPVAIVVEDKSAP